MKFSVLTLFPEMIEPCKASIVGRAIKSHSVKLEIINIRDFSIDKHKKCDDTPYGGGAGMVMTPQPLADAINFVDPKHEARRIYLSPKGRVLDQDIVLELKEYEHILLVCGHYEGIDQRIIDNYIDEELSIGDYILTGGELAANVIIDCVSRYVKGVLGNSETTSEETFSDGLLEYPQYTKPYEFNGFKVPDVLLSGNHAEIKKWRADQSLKLTKEKRNDLLS